MSTDSSISLSEYIRNREFRQGMIWPPGMRRIVMAVEYDGSAFQGFQVQKQGTLTVQDVIQKALSFVADEPITLVCCGRTDSGVHATQQIIHFDTLASRPMRAWQRGVNTRLPAQVRVLWAKEVEPGFHSRFSALSRTYSYLILNTAVHSAIYRSIITCIKEPLDAKSMHEAAQFLVGEHDFSSFRAAQCQANHPVRTVTQVDVQKRGAVLKVQITANAFLYNMVRNIVGSLVDVGNGKYPIAWFKDVLESCDRTVASMKAPANGLYFVGVDYGPAYPWPELQIKQPLLWPGEHLEFA